MKAQLIRWGLVIPVLALLTACSNGGGGNGGGGGGGGGGIAVGILDTTFGINGIVIDDNAAGGSKGDYGRASAVDAAGNVLVAGDSWSGGNYDVALWRFTSSGTLDTGFGSGGVVTHDNAAGGNGTERGYALAIDAVGNILVAGGSWGAAGNVDMALWRFTPSGALDTGFGTTGFVTHDGAAGGSGGDYGLALAIDAAGNILVAGESWGAAGNMDMALWRFTPSGALDTGFGTNGIVTHDNAAGGGGWDVGYAVAVDADGSILVAGYSTDAGTDRDLVLWRFTSSGALDVNFGTNGVVTHDSATGWAMEIDAVGNILVAGASWSAGLGKDMALWRFTSSGALDASFGTNGIVTHDGAAGGSGLTDLGSALAIDAAGNILVAGESRGSGSNTDMALCRFTPSGALDTGFGTNGVETHDNAAGGSDTDRGSALALDAAGNILVAGESINASGNADMVLWRYR